MEGGGARHVGRRLRVSTALKQRLDHRPRPGDARPLVPERVQQIPSALLAERPDVLLEMADANTDRVALDAEAVVAENRLAEIDAQLRGLRAALTSRVDVG